MDAVSYPDEKVVDFVEKYVVPCRVPSSAEPHATEYGIKWTPTLVLLDGEGREHQRTVGFIPPEELVPTLLLGIAKAHFNRDEHDHALNALGMILEDYPRCDEAPEAVYMQGICLYKSTRNAGKLREAYDRLLSEFPSSAWFKRAYPYRLLEATPPLKEEVQKAA